MDHKPYTVQDLVSNPSFVQWAEGNSDSDETWQWDRWIELNERNRITALKAQKIIAGISFKDPDLSHLEEDWQHVRTKIARKPFSVSSAYGTRDKPTDFYALFLKVAALVLIITTAGIALYLYQEPEVTEQSVATEVVQTKLDEKKTINLSDGSTIILAAGSQLTYKENWLSQPVKRLRLEGEAFFSITPKGSKGQPKFLVETVDGTVAVWGTRFTVAAYGNGSEVVLQEGEVTVDISGLKEPQEVHLKPGEKVRFRKSVQDVLRENVNPLVYTSWTSDQLFFDDTPLSVLMDRIRRTYGVKVTVESPQLLDMKLSGAVDFRSLDSLIAAVDKVLDISIVKSGNKVIIK